VGAVIVDVHGVIVSTGYNGSPRGLPHCADVGCLIEPETGRCKRTVHAEANAIIQAGPKAWGGTLYCTHQPCSECSNLILNAGIRHVFFIHPYKSQSKEIASATDDNFFRAGVSFACIALEGD